MDKNNLTKPLVVKLSIHITILSVFVLAVLVNTVFWGYVALFPVHAEIHLGLASDGANPDLFEVLLGGFVSAFICCIYGNHILKEIKKLKVSEPFEEKG